MFSFDHAALPQLTTRKALILVDFQNDFLAPDGALPVSEPAGFVDRAVELAATFRSTGDVVWVQSRFDEPRLLSPEQIVASDTAPAIVPATRPSSRLRRKILALEVDEEPDDEPDPPGSADPEAFLSHDEPACVKASSPGCEMPVVVKDAVRKGDLVMSKTHYSAFHGTHLLRMLRAKMVIEVFICGSLANVGVYATALDAAGHGMAITVVEDCCGYRSEARQAIAVRKLIELTGCEIASYKEVIDIIKPQPPPKSSNTASSSGRPAPSTHSGSTAPKVGRASMSPDIVQPMTGLRLASGSPAPVAPEISSSTLDTVASTPAPTPNVNIQPEDTPLVPREAIKSDEKPKTETKIDKKSTQATREDAQPHSTTSTNTNESTQAAQDVTKPHHPSSAINKEPAQATRAAPKPHLPCNSATKMDSSIEAKAIPSSPLLAAEPDPTSKSSTDTDSDDEQLQQRGLCDGDTDVIEDLLPAALEQGVFEKLRDEIRWQRMSHQGGEVPRLVAVQGEVAEDGSIPIYRHPSDESPPLLPFSPTVIAIKAATEKHLGHPLNHVLIQHYRDGNDYISEHSDKTLDIVRGSYIANVSLGAQRTMVLRTKRLDKDPSRTDPPPEDLKRKIQRATLPHNSLCRMGLRTNMKWLHSIRQDKRADRDKSAAERAYSGARISLTFRQIGTFLDRDETVIWGQGATGKTRKDANAVINGQTPEAIKMLQGFGTENHASAFEWDAYYGKGFDVLHMRTAPRFFTSVDPIINMRISIMLAECGVSYANGSMPPAATVKEKSSDRTGNSNLRGSVEPKDTPEPQGTPESKSNPEAKNTSLGPETAPIKFVDNDAGKSVVHGDLAIMLYLDSCYGQGKTGSPAPLQAELANRFTRFQQGIALLDKWRHVNASKGNKSAVEVLKKELAPWNSYAADAKDEFLAGSAPSLPDFAVWPVLHAIVEEHGADIFDGLGSLLNYYRTMLDRESIKKALIKANPPEKGK